MLATFRNHAKGWAAWVFVIIVTVPFAFWGISQYRSLVTTDYVAKVNGVKIMPQAFQRVYQQTYEQKQTQLGDKFDPTQQQQKALKDQVLQQLIRRSLLRQQAAANGLVVGEADVRAQIEQVPAFQSGGKFDFDRYQAVLAANNYSIAQFESNVRRDLTVQELQDGIQDSAFAVPSEVDSLIGLLKQKRKIAWFIVPLSNFMPKTPPTDAQVAAYYHSHQSQYSVPTTVTINYVQLDPATLEGRVSVTSANLQDYYDTHQNQFGIPPARKAAQILVKPQGTSVKAWEQAALKAADLLAEIKQSSHPLDLFAKLAKADSDDKTSSRNGGSLGWIARGQMPKPFDQALFGIAKVGGVAGPVRTADGWHLIQLLGQRGGSVKPFADVKDQVKAAYLKSKASDLYYQLGDKLANIAYEHPDSLDPVAKGLGLDIHSVAGVSRSSGTGVAKNDKVRAAAFSDSVLKEHQNSQPVKLGPNDAVVLRVSDVVPGHPKPLSAVHDSIVAALQREEASQAARDATSRALHELRGAGDMKKVALSLGLAVQGPTEVGRSDASLPQALRTAAFATPPRAGSDGRYASVELKSGNYALFQLLGVVPGKEDTSKKSNERQAFAAELGQLDAGQAFDDYVAWLRSQAEIKIDKDNIP